jgi:hypothetical protein
MILAEEREQGQRETERGNNVPGFPPYRTEREKKKRKKKEKEKAYNESRLY